MTCFQVSYSFLSSFARCLFAFLRSKILRMNPPKGRTRQHIRDRLVYNDWDLYSFVQMLTYKCLRFGKALSIIDEQESTHFICLERQQRLQSGTP